MHCTSLILDAWSKHWSYLGWMVNRPICPESTSLVAELSFGGDNPPCTRPLGHWIGWQDLKKLVCQTKNSRLKIGLSKPARSPAQTSVLKTILLNFSALACASIDWGTDQWEGRRCHNDQSSDNLVWRFLYSLYLSPSLSSAFVYCKHDGQEKNQPYCVTARGRFQRSTFLYPPLGVCVSPVHWLFVKGQTRITAFNLPIAHSVDLSTHNCTKKKLSFPGEN